MELLNEIQSVLNQLRVELPLLFTKIRRNQFFTYPQKEIGAFRGKLSVSTLQGFLTHKDGGDSLHEPLLLNEVWTISDYIFEIHLRDYSVIEP